MTNDIELLISDVLMPNMDGIELSNEIRKIKPNIPIVFITSIGLADIPDELLMITPFYLEKPINLKIFNITMTHLVNTLFDEVSCRRSNSLALKC